MNSLILYLGEWPWIFTIAIAVYLAFEHWRFPDLTIESSFVAGMASTYFAMSDNQLPLPSWAILIGLSLITPFLLALATWMLAHLDLPPFFAGLVVSLSAYSLNYHLNGNTTSQDLETYTWSLPALLRRLPLAIGDYMFLLSLLILVLTVASLILFARTRTYIRMTLARRTPDPNVPTAIGINRGLYLLAAMWLYDVIAFWGGIGWSLQNSNASVSFLGAIVPGLCCMFAVRQIRHWAAAPVIAPRQGSLKLSQRLLMWSDSMVFVLISLGVASFLIALARLFIHSQGGPGLLNAYTAFGMLVVWVVFGGAARLLGKATGGEPVGGH